MILSDKVTGATITTDKGPASSGTVTVSSCQWCGMIHLGSGICPDVKAIEYYPDGAIKRVEFYRRWYIGE